MTTKEIEFMIQVALGVFSVDSEGNVWRHGRMMGGSHTGTDSYIKMFHQKRKADVSIKSGYPTITFSLGHRRRYNIMAHRIVWMIINHSDIPKGMEINHKDGIRKNHHPSNLEVTTHSKNALHGIHMLGRRIRPGQRMSSVQLTEQDVVEIRELWAKRAMTQKAIADHYGTYQTTIGHIVRGETWKDLL